MFRQSNSILVPLTLPRTFIQRRLEAAVQRAADDLLAAAKNQ
jgi:hypothetical protein